MTLNPDAAHLYHPRNVVSDEQCAIIRKYAGEAEQLGHLHEEQLAIIYRQNWFRMFVPKYYGGLNYSLPEVLKVEEALAWIDASTGWVVTLCSGAGWFAGFLEPKLAAAIFNDDHVCIAGSGAPTGTAEQTGNGYRINGSWKYATGSPFATMFTANCVITKGGKALTDESGNNVVMAFIFYSREVQINNAWQSMGMIATASHGFSVRDLAVPFDRAFVIDGPHATVPAPVYQYPFMQLAETTLAVNYAGMAQRFIDLCDPVFHTRMSAAAAGTPNLADQLTRAQQSLDEARRMFYQAADTSWSYCGNGEPIPPVVSSRVSRSSHELYKTAISLVQKLYPLAGLTAADPATEINRVWRNIHTASQHTLLALR